MQNNRILSFRAISWLMVLSAFQFAFGQNDPQSKSVLEKTSTINNGYKSIVSDFTYSSSNTQTKESTSENGKITMKGDKYHLSFNNSEIYFDGKDVYNYLPKANEVTITVPEPSKNEKGMFLISNPRDIFKFYTKNFKSKLVKETAVKGKTCFEVDLYPIDLKTVYSRIRMHIDKTSYQIIDIKIFQKDGTQQTLEFNGFKANSEVPDSKFVFDQNKYPGIVVNDMRF
jgi:outer membrane lipoprotein carrier protein